MDRFRQKSKKDQPLKHVSKDKTNFFNTDVKCMNEHLKIKEILRTVKMNNSMRIKAPRGSKIMQIRDFNDNDEFDGSSNTNEVRTDESSNSTNATETLNKECIQEFNEVHDNVVLSDEVSKEGNVEISSSTEDNLVGTDVTCDGHAATELESISISNNNDENIISNDMSQRKKSLSVITSPDKSVLQPRERKLSLDQTMLNRRESFSQSELDLHSIGKSPLERKSSFFRKKMENFFKNTTEIFKRQTLDTKSQLQRRGSMSVSLQSLNENVDNHDNGSISSAPNDRLLQSSYSLRSSPTVGCSTSSLCSQGEPKPTVPEVEGESFAGSQQALSASQNINYLSSESINSLNEAYIQESLLSSRAISMSSGLDTALGNRTRKASRSNRVTWLASEGLTNYLRRIIQDEKNKEINVCHSYQDLTSIPEYSKNPKTDSKGRRLSYQRAVSGEDPVQHTRYQETSLRKRGIPEYSEADFELANQLSEFSRNGVPPLQGFCISNISDEAFAYLVWAEKPENLIELYDWKKLNSNEESRQAVIRELVSTEADYIRHLISIVEVFIAAAHALQDSGKLLDVDTMRLFSNIPDVLNASLCFWEMAIFPMLADALENGTPFNTEQMSEGFCRFREIFMPYQKYVSEQTKALDYLRSLSGNTDFMAYLTWCHGHKSCNRLQLSDILVKPMQRLTKYSLIIRRIITHTDTEPERTNLIAMERFAKNYVLDLNRSIRQREEIEKLEALSNSIDVYEVDFKDEDLDRYFRMFSQLNLRAPMVNCLPSHSRSLIYQGDLRFKDNAKEIEVRVYLLTDMLLICKKMSKGSLHPYKLIRQKYMVDRMVHIPKYSNRINSQDIVALLFVVLDDVGSSFHTFALFEPAKDSNPHATLKIWEQKLREAKLTYDIGVWFARNPSRDLSEVDMNSSSDYALSLTPRPSSDDANIEREARECVAAMLHRSVEASTEYDFSQASLTTDSFDGKASGTSGARTPAALRHPMHRNSTGGSSRNSRLSSFQQSTSAASHDEPQTGPSRNPYTAGTSVEHLIPPQNPDDAVTSITVNVVSESESETVVPSEPAPMLQQSPSTSKSMSKSPSKTSGKSVSKLPSRSVSSHKNTLRVQPQSGVMALVHSLPDLTIDPSPPRPSQSPSPQSASEKLYQSHQELLQRNRLSASQHHQYLTPDHRGTSYPPPSPTRASLKRGLAFSHSFKNPPLSKMGHVNSQSQLQAEAGPSNIQKSDKTPVPAPAVPSTSTEKTEKKSKFISARNKATRSLSPTRKEDKDKEDKEVKQEKEAKQEIEIEVDKEEKGPE